MRPFLRWFLCVFPGVLTLLGQPVTEAAANVSCFERIIVPDYPALARQARIAGDVRVSVVIGHDPASYQVTTQLEKLQPTRLALSNRPIQCSHSTVLVRETTTR
jgi:hypothetical protein